MRNHEQCKTSDLSPTDDHSILASRQIPSNSDSRTESRDNRDITTTARRLSDVPEDTTEGMCRQREFVLFCTVPSQSAVAPTHLLLLQFCESGSIESPIDFHNEGQVSLQHMIVLSRKSQGLHYASSIFSILYILLDATGTFSILAMIYRGIALTRATSMIRKS